MNNEYLVWEKSIIEEIDFYRKLSPRSRKDDYLPWKNSFFTRFLIRDKLKYYLRKIGIIRLYKFFLRKEIGASWFKDNSQKLWGFREKLNDLESIFNLDSTIVLRNSSPFQYYFKITDFTEIFNLISRKLFKKNSFPSKYLEEDLFINKIQLNGNDKSFNVIATKNFLDLLNRYQQYLPIICGERFLPEKGETVIDCGSCIGDMSVIFAQLVGEKGKVFMLDPIPLHNKFAKIQIEMNPDFKNILNPYQYAVGLKSSQNKLKNEDVKEISPAGLAIKNYQSVSLDDFCMMNKIKNVDYIKMDIEGFEVDALNGAKEIIKKFKPKLAISAYHKDDDFWIISNLIHDIYPEYKLYFRHHTPMRGESVIYAIP